MFKKINVLAAVLQMDRPFTMEELAERSGVVRPTVRTVLQRYTGLFDEKKLPPTGPGGQRIEYTLTQGGKQTLLEELGRLPTVDALPTRTPLAPPASTDVPEALMATESMLKGVANIPAADISAFLDRAERRLGWAVEDASSSTFAGKGTEIERRIGALREAIANARPVSRPAVETAEQPKPVKSVPAHVRHLGTFAPGMAFVSAMSISEAPRHTPARRLANALRKLVFIHSVGVSAEPLQFAMFGDGALLSLERASRLWSAPHNLLLERLDIDDAKAAWAGDEHSPTSGADVLLCFNSQKEPGEVERALEVIQSNKVLSSGLLLDVGHSRFVDDFVRQESRFKYQCKVQDFPVTWVDLALNKMGEVGRSMSGTAAAV